MILRLSLKLQSKLKLKSLPAKPLDQSPYADWSSHVFTVNRAQYILLTNSQSLYSCMLHGGGISNDRIFIERVLGVLREFMEYAGLTITYEKFVAPECGRICFGKALNRSVTGSMNDMVRIAKLLLMDELSPFDVGFKLNEMPMSALQYSKPQEAFKSLIDGRES
jgi:hypothetical protein